jgi:trehalose 6-phosphate synthase
MRGRSGSWVAAPMTDEDRAQSPGFELRLDGGALRMRFAQMDPETYNRYYDEISNRLLWFLHHYLWETPLHPQIGPVQFKAWDSYVEVNTAFADAVMAESPADAIALPQDYHLSLVPGLLRKGRPDLRSAFFWHIPFCQPDQFRVLPDTWATALLEGMLGADVVGFQTERWADNFLACCRAVLGARTRGRLIMHAGRTSRVGIYPVGVNREHLREEAARDEVTAAGAEIDEIVGDRSLILRVDRTELSKNILRGLAAYESLLERRIDLRQRVVHLALLQPSRRNVPEYTRYIEACIARTDQINERFSTPGWQPVELRIEDNYARTLAAYRRYDVLVVNPVYDGMNLVAREGPLLNERDGVLVLSRNAGAAIELRGASTVVNPFDIDGTSLAIEEALEFDATERAARARKLRPMAQGTTPEKWLDRQVNDLLRLTGA